MNASSYRCFCADMWLQGLWSDQAIRLGSFSSRQCWTEKMRGKQQQAELEAVCRRHKYQLMPPERQNAALRKDPVKLGSL